MLLVCIHMCTYVTQIKGPTTFRTSHMCTHPPHTQLSARRTSLLHQPIDRAAMSRGSKSDGIITGQSAWLQTTTTVKAPGRGCHLITSQITSAVPELSKFKVGTMSVFIQHTSASLTINENADPDVRSDMETALNMIVKEEWAEDGTLKHVDEGSDDITGHVKASLLGPNLGRLNLGTWQGIYLCEHRNQGGWGGGHSRKVVITVNGLV